MGTWPPPSTVCGRTADEGVVVKPYAVLDAVATATAVLCPEGRVVHWNLAMAEHTGVEAERAVGRRLDEVIPTLAGMACMDALLASAALPEAWQAPAEIAACLGTAAGAVPRAVWVRPWLGTGGEEDAAGDPRAPVLVLTVEPPSAPAPEGLGLLRAVAPDLRTPLLGLRAHADLLAQADLGPARFEECVAAVQRSGEQLQCLVEGLLELAAMDAGEGEVHRDVTDPRRLLRERLDRDQDVARQKSALLELEVEASTPARLDSDLSRVRQILDTLVDAATDAASGGRISVVSRGTRAEWTVIVRGIAPREVGQLERWFDPGGGRGPRLALARRWAGRLGGSLGVERTVEGRGAFRLTLPTDGGLVRANPGRPSARAAKASDGSKAGRDRHGGARILLAEDGPDQRRLTAGILRQAGWDVVQVGDGHGALEEVERASRRQLAYDVILINMQMPEMDGLEATRRLRRQGYRGAIVALTEAPLMGDKKRCFDAGCDAFAPKPIERKSLLDLVQRMARREG